MYYGTGTGADAVLHMRRTDTVFALIKWQHFSTFLRETTSWPPSGTYDVIMKQLLSIDAYLLERQSCQISFRSDLKRRSLMRCLKVVVPQEQEEEQKMSSDMRSVPDPKYLVQF